MIICSHMHCVITHKRYLQFTHNTFDNLHLRSVFRILDFRYLSVQAILTRTRNLMQLHKNRKAIDRRLFYQVSRDVPVTTNESCPSLRCINNSSVTVIPLHECTLFFCISFTVSEKKQNEMDKDKSRILCFRYKIRYSSLYIYIIYLVPKLQ
jgi:hypothetical protein